MQEKSELKKQKMGKLIKPKLPIPNTQIIKNVNIPIHQHIRYPHISRNYIQLKLQQVNLASPTKQGMSTPRSQNSSLNQSRMSNSKSVRFSVESDKEDFLDQIKIEKSPKKSILKNRIPSKKQKSVKSLNSNNSHGGTVINMFKQKQSIVKEGLACQNVQYQKMIKRLYQKNQKYFDDVFLAGSSSLFYSKGKDNIYKNVRWVRIGQIYQHSKILLLNHNLDIQPITFGIKTMEYAVLCFNALSRTNKCLQIIFEHQQYNQYGIYYVRLNQQGIWKYVVVDDLIPAYKDSNNKLVPFHINIIPNQQVYYIWPIILLKAFAKLYSCYQCLQNEKVNNFMNELTGFVDQQIVLDKQFSDIVVKTKLSNLDSIIITEGSYSIYEQQHYLIINSDIHKKKVEIMDGKNEKKNIEIENLKKYFKALKIYQNRQAYYSLGCKIIQKAKSISIRSFQIQQNTSCDLSIIQKDKKHFRNQPYHYSWVRIILAMKEGFTCYRWINGKYLNHKVVSIDCYNLLPGLYYVIIMVDWNSKPYQLTLNYQGNTYIKLNRQINIDSNQLIRQTCIDASQRFGIFKQLSKQICCYRYIDLKDGFIIENIHNESKRQLFYHRTYQIQGRYQIISAPLTNNNQLEVFINPYSEFTFILKFLNGPDQHLISNFSFGFG